ncbi:HAMP domain-containing histidine kinase, partial [bacterium]|nr:HAMP domain-containing histidine kinase [bacterium]
VTEEMKLERQIREKSKLVELGTIGSSIAHELNNPLAGMLSYLQLLLMDEPKGTEFYKDLKEMESATLRCRDIVLSLLGFSRKQSLENQSLVPLYELVQKSVQLMELKSRFRKVSIEIENRAEGASILGDQNSLMQGLTHILANSIEALEERLEKEENFMAKIKISIQKKEKKYLIEIRDNGPGISEKNLSQVINPLFTTKTSTDHAGLGLTVAYSIFSEHHGSLELESLLGQGVAAIISFPRPENEGSSRGIDTQI